MNQAIAAAVLALGVAAGGWFVGTGFAEGRASERIVTVKGVAERAVKADTAVWPLTVVASANELAEAHRDLERSVELLSAFLEEHGIAAEQVHMQGFSVNDTFAARYGSGRPAGNRYVINQTLMVRTSDPATALAASAKVAELVGAGVVLQSGNGYQSAGPAFLFTRLNDLKPEMIAEATARAREAAEQFAIDSGSRLGNIRRANQGVFQILPRDKLPGVAEAQQIDKVVRVVSTVQYFLE